MKVSGTFKQVNSALYLCIGFIPDWVKIWNLTDLEDKRLEWNINMRQPISQEGYILVGDDAAAIAKHDLAYGEGVSPYRGGDYLNSASSVYLAEDPDPDKRDAGTGDVIDTFTIDTPANRTGHFNAGCNTSLVGVGSKINIDGKVCKIQALTNDGDAADEVTLSEDLKSGEVRFLGGMYDFIGMAAGTTTKPGIKLSDTTYLLDAATDMLAFEAGKYR